MKRSSSSHNKYDDFLKKPKKNVSKLSEVKGTRADSGSPANFSGAESDGYVSDCNDTENMAPEKTEVVAPEKKEVLRASWGASYEILENIGSGVYGNVYLVSDVEKKEKFAMKVMRNFYEHTRQIFDSETQVMKHIAKANHKSFVKLLQCGDLKRTNENVPKLAILMDICGPSLFKVISDVKEKHKDGYVTFPCSDIKNIGSQLAVALDQLEKLTVYHLDVKPENIYFSMFDVKVNTEKEDAGTVIRMSDLNVCIGDFGCSKFHDRTRYSQKKLSPKQTQNYRSPEIIMGLPHSIKSDVWSFGCVLSEMYTGELLFYGNIHKDTEMVQFAMMQRIMSQQPSWKMWRHAYKINKKVDFQGDRLPAMNDRIFSDYLRVKPFYSQRRAGHKEAVPLFHLLRDVLTFDPDLRPSFADLVNHSFFKEVAPKDEDPMET